MNRLLAVEHGSQQPLTSVKACPETVAVVFIGQEMLHPGRDRVKAIKVDLGVYT